MVPSDPPPRDGAATTISTEPGVQDPVSVGGMLLVSGQGRLQPYRIHAREVVIGRAPDCDVVINDRMLSRRHAILRLGSPVTVQDLGSTNGTRVARRVCRGGEPVVLQDGESFHIGPFSFLLMRATSASDPSGRSGQGLLRVIDPTFENATPILRDIACADATVLILGETGAGKEVLADTVHRLSGRSGPLMRINCAALAESLLESELFGHEKGAFTGATATKAGLLEAAQGGTVFLDEVGEMPASTQAKLLRALEAREVMRIGSTRPISIDARFIAATNRDLAAEVEAGRFRRDLYFRLDGITVHLPPLRARRTMIVPLALKFLAAASARSGAARASLSSEVIDALQAHPWPGNVRELKAVIERAVLLAKGNDIGLEHLALSPPTPAPAPAAATAPAAASAAIPPPAEPDPGLYGLSPAELAERAHIIAELEACAGNQTRAAKRLGMSRTTLVTRLQHYRIPRPRGR
jgi:two-component system, NtrC family, response regulator AtoC